MTARRVITTVLLTLCLGLAREAVASPIITAQVDELAGGVFQYRYTLENPADSGETLYDFALRKFDGDILAVSGPDDWEIFFGYSPADKTGFIDWYSPYFEATDIMPGTKSDKFVFTSLFGPGQVLYQIYTSDVSDPFSTSFVEGFVLGPVASTPVPEPGTMLLVGTGMLGAWRARRRRQGGKIARVPHAFSA